MKTKIKKSRLDIWKHCHIGIVDLFLFLFDSFPFTGKISFLFLSFFIFPSFLWILLVVIEELEPETELKYFEKSSVECQSF